MPTIATLLRKEGRQEGRQEMQESIARNLLLSGVNPECVAKSTYLSKEKVEEIKKKSKSK